ncbi:hypothetical protein CEXT_159781 [Caerostris extrusa]|uniref:Uncharacterized protein n=1 Tax=Caerostris extrusa TaxID=172846 RepID=A0AAV4PNV0_CAEEX|nr:hypothetical protein CEXT_159781 [Caerostris extrusa]
MDPQEKCKKVDVYAISTESIPNKAVDPTKTFWHIDKEMLYFKLHFFLFMGGNFLFLLLIIPKIENPQNESAFEISSELINVIMKSESHQYSGNSSKQDGQYFSIKDDFYVSSNNTDLKSSDECTIHSVKSNHSGTSENNSKKSLLWTSLKTHKEYQWSPK